MTYNQIIQLFDNICSAHKGIKSFDTGELFEKDGLLKPGIVYPMIYAIPLENVITNQTEQRKFTILCMDLVDKQKTFEQEVISDTEQYLKDFIKVLRLESADYEVLGDPLLIPFKEEAGDWVSGWRSDIVIQSVLNSGYCDVPSDSFVSPSSPNYVTIYDQDGNVVIQLTPGQSYTVTIVSAIDGGRSNTVFTNYVIAN